MTSKRTPLHTVHSELGAAMTDFAGWSMPLRYTSETAEHHAVRTAAGLFDLSHMGEIRVAGPQAAAALDYALVGLLSAVAIGRARYTMLCQPDGGVLDDLIVYRLAVEEYMVVANAANTTVVLNALTERAKGFDVVVADRTDSYALIALQGPKAVEILAELTPADLSAIKYYAFVDTAVAGRQGLLARTGYTGEDGFEFFCAPEDAAAVWSAIAASDQVTPAGLACRDTLRLEAGMPLYGHELSADQTPYEAGLGRVVKLEKDNFVGRDALAQRAEKGVDVTLVGLVSQSRRSPRAGYPVVDPATSAEVGTVTSGSPSPTLGHPIAMAYVSVESSKVGTALAVDVRGRHEPVEVVALPFYHRPAGSP